MPRIAERKFYDGAEERIARLGLTNLSKELDRILTGFELRVKEEKDSNGGAVIRALLDERFQEVGGWTKKQTGDVDWVKCLVVNGTRVCLGVEIQFSGRGDMLIIDVAHLREQINTGLIDVGVIVVATDRLGQFLTDRAARYADAIRAVKRAQAEELPLLIVALEHDGPGEPLPKMRTRQGRLSSN